MTRRWCWIPVLLLLGVVVSRAQTTESPGTSWDRRYDRPMYVYGKEPVDFLRQIVGRLRPGAALVLAAGEGRNAVFLAQQGFAVTAVDVSPKGLEKCLALAIEHGVTVDTIVADLDTFDMGEGHWDLITDFYYHDTSVYKRALRGLKSGGFFLLQNFTIDQPSTGQFGPRNSAWLVTPNQLPRAFDSWRIRHYEDVVVDLDEGMHKGPGAVVRLLVEKTPVGQPQD